MKLRPILQVMVALALCFTLVVTSACNKQTIQKIADKSAVITQFVATADVPGQLLAQHLITEVEANAVREKVNAYRDAAIDFDNQVRAAIESGASLASLGPVFATSLQRLNEIGALTFGNAAAQAALQKILGVAVVAATVIAGFFAAVIVTARARGMTDQQICARLKVPYIPEQFRVLRDFAAQRDPVQSQMTAGDRLLAGMETADALRSVPETANALATSGE